VEGTDLKRLIAIILVILLIIRCSDKVNPGKTDVERPAVTGVVVIKVHPSQVDRYYETSGTVRAKTISTISSRVMGTVTSINVREGDRVSKGEQLLTIDDRDLTQKMKTAEEGYKESLKALEVARENRSLMDITYARYKDLYDDKAISEQEMDEIKTKKRVSDIEYQRAQATAKGAEAAFLETQINHGFAKITAPISGVITEKKTEVGSMAVPGTPLLTVEDDSSFRMEVNVDERLSESLKVGMPVSVIIDSIGERIKGQISEIVPTVDPMSRSFLIKIDIKGESLRTGLYGRVLIPESKRETILVPKDSVVEKGQLVGVYAADDKGIMTYRLIKTGKMYNEKVEVVSGLSDGDRIVADGAEKVVDGGIVKP
jgi:RND family efflux transporter MFP subunit